ncbi:Antirestriction protein KlcA [compost metagenome]
MLLEPRAFAWMDRLCEAYNGGYWNYYTLSNGGAFIAPDSEDNWAIFNKLNGNSAEMGSEAAGIAVCLLNWSHHACRTGSPAMSEHYYHLREFALSHPESNAIMHIID